MSKVMFHITNDVIELQGLTPLYQIQVWAIGNPKMITNLCIVFQNSNTNIKSNQKSNQTEKWNEMKNKKYYFAW